VTERIYKGLKRFSEELMARTFLKIPIVNLSKKEFQSDLFSRKTSNEFLLFNNFLGNE